MGVDSLCRRVCSVVLIAAVAFARCSDNDIDSCGDCSLNAALKCVATTNVCEGMENTCKEMQHCTLNNSSKCVPLKDKCTTAKYCSQCQWNHNSNVCVEMSNTPPVERMSATFFSSGRVVVLWTELNIKSNGVYVVCLILSFMLSCSAHLSEQYIEVSRFSLIPKMIIKLLSVVIANLVMLALMISNAGLFVAITLGSTVGYGLTERFKSKKPFSRQNTNTANNNTAPIDYYELPAIEASL